MTRRYLLCLICAIQCLVSTAQDLKTQLDALLTDELLTEADAAVAIYDLTSKKMIYSHRNDKLCRPASTLKLITTIAALDQLGTSYDLRTSLYASGTWGADSILHGDLYIVGGFDPEFTISNLDSLIAAIPQAGIRSITGSVIADVSMADTTYWGSGWCWDDAPAAFQPYYSPLLLEKGCVEIHVDPTHKDSIATITCYPPSAWYEIDNRTCCYNDSAGMLQITRDWQHGSNRITLTGNVERTLSKKMSIYTADRHFMALLTERMLRAGIGVGETTYGICPPTAQCIATIQRPVTAVVQQALKESDNLSAEAILYHLAAASGKPYASATDAIKRTDSMLLHIHNTYYPTEKQTYPHKIVDGSGLSNYNMISPQMLLDVLRYAYDNENIHAIITDALPHCGIDGTLKYRMGTKEMRNRIVAKTGSMTGISTLAGYAHTNDAHTLAFVIMNQNVLKLSQARAWQDKVCRALVTAKRE